MVVKGSIITVNYFSYFSNAFDDIDYDLRVNEVIKGEKLKVGDIITLHIDCSHASEMAIQSNIFECIQYTPKIGDNQSQYFNLNDTADTQQSIIYGNNVVGVNLINNATNSLIFIIILILGMPIAIIVLLKNINQKNNLA